MPNLNTIVNLYTMKNKYLFILPLFATTLCGCNFFGTTIIYPPKPYIPTHVDPISPFQEDEGKGYKKYYEFTHNLQTVNRTHGSIPLQSLDDTYLLIVPVQFSNGPAWNESTLDIVNKGFFGTYEDTGWESVKSFYEKSSYGKLTLHGEIAPVLKMNITTTAASKKLVDGKPAPDELVTDVFVNNPEYDSYRKKYDKDEDGFVDSVVFVYSNSIDSDKGYWAWVYWDNESPDEEVPSLNSYLWMSYNFFTGSNYCDPDIKIDCHTAIHETGHLFGLDDYYQYDEDNKFDPSGGIEMHSYNIGDENIYSKFALGWVNPYYVKTDSSVTLTLRTSAFYGDAILINDYWNENSMDEYLIVEYYSPLGLNERDSNSEYKGNRGSDASRMYTTSGFRIYHIDSRIVEFVGTRKAEYHYVNEITDNANYVIASNSPSRSQYPKGDRGRNDFKYVHLLEDGGVNTFKDGKVATNDTLFKQGSSFEASNVFFVNGNKFNNGKEVGYRITVGECTETTGKITVTKI